MTRYHDENSSLARLFISLVALVGVPITANAQGQPKPGSDIKGAAAQVLFEDGRRLMEAERLSEACPKLAESFGLEAATGTLLNLALCHEQEGKTATAWLEYNDALARSAHEGDEERKEFARQRIILIEPSLSRLVLLLPPGAGNDLWIDLDGVRLPSVAWSAGVPVDPGMHVVAVGATSKVTAVLKVEIKSDARRFELQLPDLVDGSGRVALPAAVAAAQPIDRNGMRLRWALTGATLGLGAAGIGFGTYFAIRASDQWNKSKAHCRSGCDEQGVMYGGNARSSALMSTISTTIGIMGLGVGVYLYLRSSHTDETGVQVHISGSVDPGRASLTASGEF